MKQKRAMIWKVGLIAKSTGLSIRTLHHYDEIGLLKPSLRTSVGHRVYSEADLSKLQQILSLRQLGFPLEEIRECLSGKMITPLQVIQLHLDRVAQERDRLDRLHDQLSSLRKALASSKEPSIQEVIQTVGAIVMLEKYFTHGQLAELLSRSSAVDDKQVRKSKEDWAQLFDDVRAAIKRGIEPSRPEAQKLAKRWEALVQDFTGGSSDLEERLGSMYQKEKTARKRIGMDDEVWEYASKMLSYLRRTN